MSMPQTMNMDLAAIYGTPGGPTQEDLEKSAQVEFFAKVAADNKIDLSKLADEEIANLWGQVFSKTAAEGEEGAKVETTEELKDDKSTSAAAEFEAAKTSQAEEQAKFAEADFIGRQMAHSFTHELGLISEQSKEAGVRESIKDLGSKALEKIKHYGGKASDKAKHYGSEVARAAKGTDIREGLQARKNIHSDIGHAGIREAVTKHFPQGTEPEKAVGGKMLREHYEGEATRKLHRGVKRTGALYGGAAAAAGGAAYAHHKTSSAYDEASLDEYAVASALDKAASVGWDVAECDERLASVITLGVHGDAASSEKVAAAADIETAVHNRSLELLELAGYPVSWE